MRAFTVLMMIGVALTLAACGGGGGSSEPTTPGISAVSVTCSPSTLRSGQSSSCSAQVSGTGALDTTVTWAASAGSITAAGVFTAPAVASITPISITATSTQDTQRSGTATITVNPTTAAFNVHPIVVDRGPAALSFSYINGLFTSVRVCAPGDSSRCQTIDHVLVDTGAVGLRLLSAAAGGQFSLALPTQNAPGGQALAECAQFLDGFTWGPVALADVYLGDNVASAIPIQIISPQDAPAVPDSCANTGGVNENSLARLRTNGILGIGLFLQDCGEPCAQQALNVYYSCSSTACIETTLPTAQQLQHPVAAFANDNNGLIIELPAIASDGESSVTGSLVFGIGTQQNNGLAKATIYPTTPNGHFTVTYNGLSYPSSFIDSGSNGLFFLGSTSTGLPLCRSIPDFYCPVGERNLSISTTGSNNVSGEVTLRVANASALFDSGHVVFDNVGGPYSNGFDLGLPFFFGRNVYVGIEKQNTPGGLGPYWAY
jgi:hypothetical protein